jgi:hypothetical protein
MTRRAERPTQSTRLTRPKHPSGMRSEVFLVLFVHKKNSSLLLLKHYLHITQGKARETKVKKEQFYTVGK